ncbi:MAG: glycoside hydrolase family 88 protein [Paludibacteraceae bacterium]|nr:glycoside hydrolase family 88 protein [Paludibacteraceae bacterium]
MKKNLVLVLFAVLCAACTSQPAQAVTFDPNVRYSREVINARMTSWKNKDTRVGFPNANSTNGSTTPVNKAATWDYVPGVVAKGILDCWEYYQDSAWANAWYEGLRDWGLDKTAENEGGSLDDLNCTKVFFGLYDGAKPGGKYENSSNATYFMTQMERGAAGIADHKNKYSISGTSSSADGGWYHKSNYGNQMWCDGAYMGPALLAQLLAYGATGETSLSWSDVVTQFTASWNGLWDSDAKLLWHCFSTDKSTGGAGGWYYADGLAKQGGGYHSAEYWGRADGWYIMALVDVLEAMEKAGKKNDSDFTLLQGYLTQLAAGLVARQDATTGCWYQLLQYGADKCATRGEDATGSSTYKNNNPQCNYLESSGSCLITAALLKGTRLGYINQAAAGKKGYEGIINTFLSGSAGSYELTSSCQSAGLGSDRNGTAAYYLIGKDVPIQNDSEGKVLGAFLMAAVEYERAYPPKAAAGNECNCLRVSIE